MGQEGHREYYRCSTGRGCSTRTGNIIKPAKPQGMPRPGEWEAAAGVIEVLSEKNNMNSLRMYGREGPCQQPEAGKLGHTHYMDSPTPTYDIQVIYTHSSSSVL